MPDARLWASGIGTGTSDYYVTNRFTGAKSQQWNVSPIDPRIGGDYSFYEFRCASDGKYTTKHSGPTMFWP